MENKVITLQERFTLKLRAKVSDAEIIEKSMQQTGFKCDIKKCEFLGFRNVYIYELTIKRAELVRQLLKNIKVYD